jgi:arginyl-tRNA synthetase
VFKAIEEIFPWYQGRQYHLPMGMVNLVGKKMSSRTGEVVTVDSVLDEVKNNLIALIHNPELSTEEVADVAEKGTIAAVKFSVLKPNPVANTVFDIKKSVDLEGDSGPYLLYTYARCQSVMGRSKKQMESTSDSRNKEEQSLIFELFKTEKKVLMSAEKLAPSILAEHLLIVARKYNEFYAKHRIIDQPEEGWRIFLTKATASTLKLGLDLLGIKTVERM